jgi:hypothetical protein
MKHPQLPSLLQRYLAADAARNLNDFIECFAPDAMVRDERQSHVGHDAIRAWKAHADATVPYGLTPLGFSRQGARWQLLASVSGAFPGSPIELMHVFQVEDDRIVSLEIRPPVELEGKRAVVTGGTRGIGRAVVDRLAAAGAVVLAVGRTAPESDDRCALFVQADLASAEGCDTAAASILAQLGGVDLLVHVAGGSSAPAGGFRALKEQHWQDALNLNLLAAVRLDSQLAHRKGPGHHGSRGPGWRHAGARRHPARSACASARGRGAGGVSRVQPRGGDHRHGVRDRRRHRAGGIGI